MIEYDVKYLRLLSSHLDRFSQKDTYLFNFRCPVCGDSKKNLHKARGYAFNYKQGLVYKCHNCGTSMSFSKLLELVDIGLYQQYRMERFKQGNTSPKVEKLPELESKNKVVDVLDQCCEKVSSLPSSHEAVQYLERRFIPKATQHKLYYTSSSQSLEQLNEDVYKNRITDPYPRIVIPYCDRHGNLTGVAARTLGKSTLRYINIKTSNEPMIYGLDKVNVGQNIFVTEGAFDAMLLPNAVSASGSDLKKVEKVLPSNLLTYIYDNEPRNGEIVKKIFSTIEAGAKVVIFPKTINHKDLTDCVRAGLEIEELIEVLNNNTFEKLRALVKFNEWKKI